MRIWLSVVAVTLANWLIKASGPLALGDRPLPDWAVKVTGLTAPVLLAGLVVTDLGGAGWTALDLTELAGVGVAVAARLLKVPFLLAVGLGIVTTALLR